ncbi:MAG TPA: DUF3280 domain-containing protein [Steroidobacteraceae bacterium]|jgi:hypothetical protein
MLCTERVVKRLFVACVLLLATAQAPHAEEIAPPLKSVAVMEFELIDDMREFESAEVLDAETHRLSLISEELRHELDQRALYHVLDNAPAADLIAHFKALQELRECNGCEVEIGKALGADVVIVGWVQKVSNLILNINLKARDVHTGATLYAHSVDLRSNNDTSWLRGIHYIVNGLAEDQEHLR